jgi:hypothetical protein
MYGSSTREALIRIAEWETTNSANPLLLTRLNITILPPIPKTCRILDISGTVLKSIELSQTNIRRLRITHCHELKSISLPEKVTNLEIRYCDNLHRIRGFPNTLTELYLEECPILKTLPPLSRSLQSLVISKTAVEVIPPRTREDDVEPTMPSGLVIYASDDAFIVKPEHPYSYSLIWERWHRVNLSY